jgi:benzoyl-CoA reductase/2-hydroxyglutaryl-CoA dehydratase subunit BcrC/BadD/HgdB
MLPLRLPFNEEPDDTFCHAVDAFCIINTCETIERVKRRQYQIPVLSLELPATHDDFDSAPQAVTSFKKDLGLLRRNLEELAGRKIKDSDIRRAAAQCNGIREKLRALYEYTQSDASPIEWRDLFEFTRSGFMMDRPNFLNEINELDAALERKISQGISDDPRPRLMIIGDAIGADDQGFMEVIKKAGGIIVTDCVCTGSMLVHKRVPVYGLIENPLDSLVEQYLYNVPAPCMGNLPSRLNRILKTVRDFRVHGLIYYRLKTTCDFMQDQRKVIKDTIYKELLVPMLLIETDCYPVDTDEIRSKVAAFIDIIGGRV